MRRSKNYGFTLIEMMVTVAIVGVLSFLAVYMFQTYSNKAKVANGVSELRSLAGRYDAAYVSGISSPSLADLEASDSSRCQFAIDMASSPEVSLTCELLNVYGPLLGGVLTYKRAADGQWLCSANPKIAADVLPVHCR
jgi:type IV pilus assembly protein PilA